MLIRRIIDDRRFFVFHLKILVNEYFYAIEKEEKLFSFYLFINFIVKQIIFKDN